VGAGEGYCAWDRQRSLSSGFYLHFHCCELLPSAPRRHARGQNCLNHTQQPCLTKAWYCMWVCGKKGSGGEWQGLGVGLQPEALRGAAAARGGVAAFVARESHAER